MADRWRLPGFARVRRAELTEGTLEGEAVAVMKPLTYMNRSGQALARYLVDPAFVPARDLLILVDDYAIPLGTFRLRAHGSDGGHNGLTSIQGAIRSIEYPRLRIGVGPVPEDVDDRADWLLEPFADDELRQLGERLPLMTDAVDHWRAHGIEAAMNRFNQQGKTTTGDSA